MTVFEGVSIALFLIMLSIVTVVLGIGFVNLVLYGTYILARFLIHIIKLCLPKSKQTKKGAKKNENYWSRLL